MFAPGLPLAAAALIVLSACGGSAGAASDAGIDDATTDADTCVPYAARSCEGGELLWIDSCGEAIEIADECTDERPCSTLLSACCSAAASGPVVRTNYAGDVDWVFATTGAKLTLNFAAHTPATGYGMMFNAILPLGDQEQLWLAIQTNLSVQTPGLLVSRFRYGAGLSDIELHSDDSYTESALPSGDSGFIGLRQPYGFEAGGSYRIDLERGDNAGDHDWFNLTVTDVGSGETLDVGRIQIKQSGNSVVLPAGFQSQVVLYAYNVDYGTPGAIPQDATGDATYQEIPNWTFEAWYQLDDQDPTSVVSTYNADDAANQFQNLELQGRQRAVFVGVGRDVGRCTGAGELLAL